MVYMGKESEKKEWVYVYIYICMYVYMYIKRNHFAVQLKLTQHCKSITRQQHFFFKQGRKSRTVVILANVL